MESPCLDRPLRVLIVEDVDDDALLLVRNLRKGGFKPDYLRVDTPDGLRNALRDNQWDLVLSDFNMPSFDGFNALKIVSELRSDLPFIIVSGVIGEEAAVNVMKAGANDYVMKRNLPLLPTAVERSLREAEEGRQLQSAQERLRHSEEKFRSLFEGAADAIFYHHRNGSILEVNQVACLSLGMTRDELLRCRIQDFVREALDPEQTSQLECRGKLVFQTVLVGKDDREIPVEVNSRLLDYSGEQAVLSIARDISERKKTAIALGAALQKAEEARDKINAILSSIADGLIVTDPAGRVVMMNRAAEAMFSMEAESALGCLIEDVFRQGPLHKAIVEAYADSFVPRTIEWDQKPESGGSPQIIEARIATVNNLQGEKTGAIAILRDISRERELDRMKSEFVTVTAHELSTPLASIMGFAELLLDEKKLNPEVEQEALQYIYEKAEKLERIVDDLLSLNRIEFGLPIRLSVAPVDLKAVIEKICRYFANRSPHHSFEVNISRDDFVLNCDQDRMEQVLENLLSNAVKYSPGGGVVRLSVSMANGQLVLQIEDEGVGMSKEHLARVFDKFYRVDSSDTTASGLGLGLSIARDIIGAHGGNLELKSEPNRGTIVEVALPMERVCPQTIKVH
ncbi:MAG: hypothetical protein C0616_12855 [Desulfuromonas sp.]|nr:MAG: hypothetical protein C0616_12855 [Desulfuromonas sp.]